jgi:Protein of unknown function (DUF4232)
MNLRTPASRRIVAAGAITCAAVLVPATAVASSDGATRGAVPASAARTATPACTTAGLVVWLDTEGSVAAGTAYYKLEFTNLSGSTCTLFGYPGVSGVSVTGTQIGPAATRNGATPATVTLVNGATATATLGIVDVGVYPKSKCGPVTAAGLRVYPPNQTQSKVVPFPFGACAKNATYLNIAPVKP